VATARERARAELTADIKRIARDQLAQVGASALSLRAVARELGMVSSALYRYFPSRDALLTALIVDAYDAIGATAERAAAAGGDAGTRWLRVCREVRAWARASPHEWALVYGSPVPGYAAPTDTIGAALRLTSVMVEVVREAATSGELVPPARPLPEPRVMTPAALDLAGGVAVGPHEDLVERALVLVIGLVGAVSYELFGHLVGATVDDATYFDRAMAVVAEAVGLTLPIG
jgi:AcrR family transcriptional regulator